MEHARLCRSYHVVDGDLDGLLGAEAHCSALCVEDNAGCTVGQKTNVGADHDFISRVVKKVLQLSV